MTQPEGRALVAAYLKELRQQRGIEQDELADQIGVHKSTVLRAESVSLRETSDKLETGIAMARALGGDISHVVSLRAGMLPDKYPAKDRGVAGADGAATVGVAADVARWLVEQQDARIAEAARKRGAQVSGMRDLAMRFQWAALRDPDRALKVFL